jgi:hypothetical protein
MFGLGPVELVVIAASLAAIALIIALLRASRD